MVSGHDTRTAVKRAFPGREALIDRAFRSQPSFRDLCRDYRSCAEVLEEWRRLAGAGPSARAREYEELLSALASEIGSWLERWQEGAGPRSTGGAG